MTYIYSTIKKIKEGIKTQAARHHSTGIGIGIGSGSGIDNTLVYLCYESSRPSIDACCWTGPRWLSLCLLCKYYWLFSMNAPAVPVPFAFFSLHPNVCWAIAPALRGKLVTGPL